MQLPSKIKNPLRYKRHWKTFISCDYCGEQTRGRIYEDDHKTDVYCGACHRVLLNGALKCECGEVAIPTSSYCKDCYTKFVMN